GMTKSSSRQFGQVVAASVVGIGQFSSRCSCGMIQATAWQNRYRARPSLIFLSILARLAGSGWRTDAGRRLYTWDSLHGEVEVFGARRKHLGALDPVTGRFRQSSARENNRCLRA